MSFLYRRARRTDPPLIDTPFDLDCHLNDGMVAVYAPGLFWGNLWAREPFPHGATLPGVSPMAGSGEVSWDLASSPIQDNDIEPLESTATLAVLTRTLSSNTGQTVLSVSASNNSDNWLSLDVQGNGPPNAQARNGGNIGNLVVASSVRFRRAAMVGSFRGSGARSFFVRGAEFDPERPDVIEVATNATAVTVAGNNRPVIGGLYRGGSIIQQSAAHQVGLGVISRLDWADNQAEEWLLNPWQLWAPDERRVWILGAGGSSYSVDLTEAATAADQPGALLTRAAAAAESITAADAAAGLMIRPAALTEAASAADTAAGAILAGAALTEAASAADSATTGSVASGAVAEAIAAADAASALTVLGAALAESVTSTDLIVGLLSAVAAVADAVSLADAQSTDPAITAGVEEAVSAADALSAAAQLVAAVAETASAADAYAAAQQLVALITEPATAADSVLGEVPATYSVSVAELATALDQIVAALAGDGAFAGAVFRTAKGTSTSRVVAGTARNSIRGYQ